MLLISIVDVLPMMFALLWDGAGGFCTSFSFDVDNLV